MVDFTTVSQFENLIADFYGANYGIATDSCTHAIELCIRYNQVKKVTCPKYTYVGIPMMFNKLNIEWSWTNDNWYDYYYINKNIKDSAVLWKANSHKKGDFTCLSFQYQKHLSLGRGGMILCDSKTDADILKMMSYDGRKPNISWKKQNIEIDGYHYYMTPETADLGIKLFDEKLNQTPKKWNYQDYPNLSEMKVFNKL